MEVVTVTMQSGTKGTKQELAVPSSMEYQLLHLQIHSNKLLILSYHGSLPKVILSHLVSFSI